MPEQIGLQSVLDNDQFLQALQEYESMIQKLGGANDQAVNSYKDLNSAEAQAKKQTDELNSAIARLLESERVSKVMDQARVAIEKMTPAEREATLETYKLQQAQDAASQAIKKFGKAQEDQKTTGQKLYGAYTELNSGLSIVKQGMQAVGQILDATVGKFMQQAEEVRTLSLATGASYEETSRLIQVFDDAGVDASRLKAAMLALKNQGIAPSIGTIAKLADEYRLIQDPNQKVIFLTKNLGSRGTELGKIFDQTGDSIRESGKAVEESLIFDAEKIKLAEDARMAQDALNDTMTGYTNQITMAFLPGIMSFVGGYQVLMGAINDAGKAQKNMMKLSEENANVQTMMDSAFYLTTGTLQGYQRATSDAAEAEIEHNKAMEDAAKGANVAGVAFDQYNMALEKSKLDIVAIQQQALNDELAKMAVVSAGLSMGLSGPLKSAYSSYSTTIADVSKRQGEILLQIDKMTKQGYSPQGKAIQDLKTEYRGLNGEMLTATQQMSLATAQMIYQQAAAGLDADAALNLARKMGLISESDYNLGAAIETLKQKRAAGVISDEKYTEGILALDKAAKDGNVTLGEVNAIMDLLDGKVSNATVNVNTNYTESGKPPPVNPKERGKGRATGGSIPAGQATLVGERRPEVVTPRHSSYVYPSTSNYYQNYSNQLNMQMGGVNVSNGMDVAAFKAMIMQTVSEAMSMRA